MVFKNKRGQGMSTSTMVLLILGVLILVILILGFTMGWKRIAPYLESSTVDDVVKNCEASCATSSVYDYCTAPREIIDAEKNEFVASCAVFSQVDEFKVYGVASCALDCKKPCEQIKVGESYGAKDSASASGLYDVSDLADDLGADEKCFIN